MVGGTFFEVATPRRLCTCNWWPVSTGGHLLFTEATVLAGPNLVCCARYENDCNLFTYLNIAMVFGDFDQTVETTER